MNWTVDTRHSHVGFSVKHMGLMNVRGEFNDITGTIVTNEKEEFVSADITIGVDSIDTRDAERDVHLKNADFFNVSTHPNMKFRSTSITKESDSDYLVKGNFTLLGVTKPLEFTLVKTDSIKGMFGETRMAVEIDGQIDRQEYGMKYHQLADNGGLLVGNKVKLNIECELVQG
ncbi:hypothetical protein bcgnr5372_46400 [Bacillus luti]|nr:YceI family protein [Bacillus cereus]HDR8329612.1 YceI family protein [Bacillus cereus]HDR8336302.1 YceI family protein [Bacillus cereus]